MNRKDSVTLHPREQQRLHVITQLLAARLSGSEAADLLGISERQVRRLKNGYSQHGVAALVHGNRGKPSPGRLGDATRERILSLARGQYAGCNDSHLRDLLAQREGIIISRRSLARVLREASIPAARPRRAPRHRSRRDRMPQAGMLLQLDGSRHRWFGPDLPHCTLLAAVDDATGAVVAAVFREQEDAQGYLLLLRQILQHHGIPLELYHDRHSIFQRNPNTPLTLDEQLRGRPDPTQFAQALLDLGITSIAASTPQAKGRVERLWGTLQDRLVVELRLAGVTDIEAGNTFLPGFLAVHNQRFAVRADEPGSACRPLEADLDLDRVLSFRYRRTVANDNTVQFAGQILQIPPGPWRRSYARAKVIVHQFLDGSLGVWHHDRWLLRTSPAEHAPTLRTTPRGRRDRPAASLAPAPHPDQVSLPQPQAGRSKPPKPGPNHPWRKQRLSEPKPGQNR